MYELRTSDPVTGAMYMIRVLMRVDFSDGLGYDDVMHWLDAHLSSEHQRHRACPCSRDSSEGPRQQGGRARRS